MKTFLPNLVRTGLLTVALVSITGCTEAAETDQVPLVTVSEDAAAKDVVASTEATAEPTVDPTKAEVKDSLAPAIPQLSPGLDEVIRLAQAKVGEDVLMAYIDKSGQPYNPTSEEIVYLHDLGVSDKVIAEIIKRSPQKEMVAGQNTAPAEPLNIPTVKVPAVQEPQPDLAPLVSTNPATVVAQPEAPAQTVVVQQPVIIQQAPDDVQYFYPSLAPYGSWVQLDGYGWCWQPTVAVTYNDWRPYSNSGRWVYTDCGWYWQSDYSWGWAPFHYGRWFHHARRGWCWIPDRTWGPAWVSWRYSSAYCGWAPLPPLARYRSGFGLCYNNLSVGIGFEFGLGALDYTFVSVNHFYDPNPYRYCLPHSQATRVYHQTVVNNVIIQGNNNHVVINRGGIPAVQISRATRTEVQKVKVLDMSPAERNHIQPDRLVRSGGALAVYRPSATSGTHSRHDQEPGKSLPTVAYTGTAGSAGGNRPVTLRVNREQTGYTAAPNTALQRYEPASSGNGLAVLKRPHTHEVVDTSRNGRTLSAPRPVQPPQPGYLGKTQGYTANSKPPVGATHTLSAPKPVYGQTVIPSAPRPVYGPAVTLSAPKPVQPATIEEAQLSAPQPVTSYQSPTITKRSEPTKPTSNYNYGRTSTYNYGSRSQNNTTSRAIVMPQPPAPRTTTTTTPTWNHSQPGTTYTPHPSYTPSSRSSYTTIPSNNGNTRYSTIPSNNGNSRSSSRPSYTPSSGANTRVYTAPAIRSTPAPAVTPSRSYSAPQSVTLPQVSSPRPSSSSRSTVNQSGSSRGGDSRKDVSPRPGHR